MKPSERRAAMKADMALRHKESYDKKDDSGKFKSVLIKSKMGSVPMWKCKEDEHFIDIVPYFAGANNPNVEANKSTYFLDFYVHRKVGVNEDTYVCLARTYGKSCPICEHQAELRKQDDYDEELVKSMNPTRRVLYNIVCRDSDKEEKIGIQLFEVSHWLFEKEIAELAKIPRTGSFILFSDPDEGKTIFFRKKGSGATNTEYKAFKFEDRTEPITDELLDAALCLDELLHIPTYAEVKAAFFGSELDESEVCDRTKTETKVEAEESRRRSSEPEPDTSRRRRAAAEPEPEQKKEPDPDPNFEFECPGTPPEDYGNFECCDNCPDVEECEKEFNKLEEQKAKELAEKEAKEKAAKETAASTTSTGPLGRRMRPGASAAAETTTAATETAAPEEGTRRVRRRPGQE